MHFKVNMLVKSACDAGGSLTFHSLFNKQKSMYSRTAQNLENRTSLLVRLKKIEFNGITEMFHTTNS